MMDKNALVMGAGVIGLQTALTLLKAGFNVRVVAQYFPGDEHEHYTSPWAGANWRTHASRDDVEQCDWDAQTYRAWKELVAEEARTGKTGESGISMVPGVQYWDAAIEEVKDGIQSVWWTTVVDNAKEIPADQLPTGVKFGLTYTTFTINPPTYLHYLTTQITTLGGSLHRSTLPTTPLLNQTILSSAILSAGLAAGWPSPSSTNQQTPFIAINATGIGAKALTGDPDLDVIQGQTVLVKGEARSQVCRLGTDVLDVCVIIPRPGSGTTIVGSSRRPGDWEVMVREEVTRELLGKGRVLAPELLDERGDFEVIGPSAGLRPYRKGGARVEIEHLEKDGIVVIHAYGHGGAGYQNSIGSANKVLRLLRETTAPTKAFT